MSGEGATLPPFAAGVFVEDEGRVWLLGGECPSCGMLSFPSAGICARDGGTVAQRSLGSTGRIHSFTIVHIRPPFGLHAPYGIGAVDLDDAPLRVMMLLDPSWLDALAIGIPVELRAGAIGVDAAGAPCRRPYFTAAGTAR